jgi:hypothetical protein
MIVTKRKEEERQWSGVVIVGKYHRDGQGLNFLCLVVDAFLQEEGKHNAQRLWTTQINIIQRLHILPNTT